MSTYDVDVHDEFVEQYREKLKINPDDLDGEVIRQPELYFEVAEAALRAVSVQDMDYENIKRTQASVDMQIRSDLAQEGKKATEGTISAMVIARDEVEQAKMVHAESKLRAEELIALKSSYYNRAYMIRDLVQLYISGYFSEHAVRTTETDAREVNDSLNREKIKMARRRLRGDENE